MLRTRFTFAVAAAVAAVTLAITAVAFLVVRADLLNQVRQQLVSQTAVVQHEARHFDGHIPSGWVPPHSDRFGASSMYTQVVTADGATWVPAGDDRLLTAAAAISVASGSHAAYYSQATLAGVRAMILTTPLAPGLAVQVAVPVNTVDMQVTSVGETLALLSAIGVALAALVGWAVARAGLAPIGRLAAVAEEVTATGNPGGRVEVGRADELGRLAMSFNTMLGALQRSLAAQRQLVSDASHELRTPLTSMRINVELLAAESGLTAGEQREILDRVVAQVDELGQLVAGVTELARDEPPASTLQEVELEVVVAAALETARRDWPRTRFLAELKPCVVTGRAERLQIAVRNLLDNAAKFGPPDAPVEVRLAGAELTVRDHGPGIAPGDQPHVFDRFYRASAARAVPGSGLGLSIVRQVAHDHGGTIRLHAPGHGGTLMRLTFPVRPAPQPVRPAPQPVRPAPQPVRPAPQPVRPAPQPVRPAPQPVRPAPQPVRPAPQPVRPAPQPVRPAPQPVRPAPQPVRPAPQPADPAAELGQPVTEHGESAPVTAVAAEREFQHHR